MIAFLKLLSAFFQWLHDNKLIVQGANEAVQRGIKEADAIIKSANAVAVTGSLRDDPANRRNKK